MTKNEFDNKEALVSENNKSENVRKEMEAYNTYEERGRMNVVPFIISIIALIVLCCVPFEIHYGEPACYIEFENGKLMLAILLAMAFFYFLCFDMLAFCVASVNLAYIAINTFDLFLYYRSELLPGFYALWACSLLVVITHFLYPWILKKIKNK